MAQHAFMKTAKRRFRKYLRSLHKIIRRLRRQQFKVSRINGIHFLLDDSNTIDRDLDTFKSFEKEQIEQLVSLIRTHKCSEFVDVGAHAGLYSLVLSAEQSIQPLRIQAFEPDTVNRQQLYANLFLNRSDTIEVSSYGLSNKNSRVNFTRYPDNNRGKSQIDEHGDMTIEVRRGDDLLDLKHKTIAFKIDVEGHEYEVIEGLQKTLQNNQCTLQIESFDSDASINLKLALGEKYKYLCSIGNDHYLSNHT